MISLTTSICVSLCALIAFSWSLWITRGYIGDKLATETIARLAVAIVCMFAAVLAIVGVWTG